MYTSYDPPRFVHLLSLLKEHGSEYLSGQDLSDVLKISRIAVWKHIERLRTLGYSIESNKTYGYKLLQQMDTAYPWEITPNTTWPILHESKTAFGRNFNFFIIHEKIIWPFQLCICAKCFTYCIRK